MTEDTKELAAFGTLMAIACVVVGLIVMRMVNAIPPEHGAEKAEARFMVACQDHGFTEPQCRFFRHGVHAE